VANESEMVIDTV